MNTARIVTAGRESRLAVYSILAADYQDSGLLAAMMDGNLDAPAHMPAGSHLGYSQFRRDERNVAAPLLSSRTGSAA